MARTLKDYLNDSERMKDPEVIEALGAFTPHYLRADSRTLRRMLDALHKARKWGLVLLAVLNVLDIVTTYIALHNGAHEGNPLASGIIGHGFGWVIVAKAVYLGLFAWAVYRVAKPVLTTVVVWFAVGSYFMVVLINLSTLHRIAST